MSGHRSLVAAWLTLVLHDIMILWREERKGTTENTDPRDKKRREIVEDREKKAKFVDERWFCLFIESGREQEERDELGMCTMSGTTGCAKDKQRDEQHGMKEMDMCSNVG